MTLDDGEGIVINLPSGLDWQDRFKNLVRQDARYTISGSFILSEGKVKAGNTVTLAGGEGIWITYGVLKQLFAETNKVGKTYTLTMPDSTVMSVAFRQPDPISATVINADKSEVLEDSDRFNNLRIQFYRVDEVA